jgi:hypothetical protein
MNNYYGLHGISGNQTWNTSWSTVAAEIDKREPFSICNYLSVRDIWWWLSAQRLGRAALLSTILRRPQQSQLAELLRSRVYYDWPGYNTVMQPELRQQQLQQHALVYCHPIRPARSGGFLVEDKHLQRFYIKAEGNTIPMRYYHSENSGHGGITGGPIRKAVKKTFAMSAGYRNG